MNGVFFIKFFILTKTKNINICCFRVITNQTNHDYLFQGHQQQSLFFIIEKVV